jgi:hypothetical protein
MKTLAIHNRLSVMVMSEAGDSAIFKNRLVIRFLTQMEK